MPPRIAAIGVGKMGGGVARNLARHPDTSVVVYDPDERAASQCVAVGAEPAPDAVSAVHGADLVVSSLPMPADVLALARTIADRLGPDTVVVDLSTIDPGTAREVADLLGTTSTGHERFVSCLLGKGPAQAEAGDVPLFVGGDDTVLDSLTAVFDCIGATVHRLGTVEAATAFKLVSNLIGMSNLAVLAEGLAICRQAGVADDAFTRALADTGAWSYQADVRLPWMLDDDFAARFPVALGLKDLGLTVAMAAEWGIPTPVGAAGMAQLAAARAHGHGADDVTAVLKVVSPPTE